MTTNTLVAYDEKDMDLKRSSGTDGGHNELESGGARVTLHVLRRHTEEEEEGETKSIDEIV